MRVRPFIVAALGAGALALTQTGAMAGASTPGGAMWSMSGDGQWVHGAGNPGFGLVTSSDASGTYGGANMKSQFLPTTNPNDITAVSYDFNANQSGMSGGSPRLEIWFSDGGVGQLRPLAWNANTWTHEDGMTTSDWDSNGGCSQFAYEQTWTAVKACHAGSTITAIDVVNDSGWKYPVTGEQVTLDNITVNNTVATGPGNAG